MFVVKIDGQRTTLEFDSRSYTRGYQYLTPGATSSHAFPQPLHTMPVGSVIHPNGHKYEVCS